MALDRVDPEAAQSAEPGLGLWDAVSLVVGIVVGASIFRTAPVVFQNSGGPWQALAAWVLGGALSVVGALCYGELATTYARNGGDYEYLTQAYGRWAGFLFGWTQLVAVWTASVGMMAYAFGDYGVRLMGLGQAATVWLAAAAVVGVAAVNLAGVAAGKWTQNVLTVAKVLGLVGIVAAGLWAATSANGLSAEAVFHIAPSIEKEKAGAASASFGLAMVFVLYAYGGWNDAAFVAAEVRDRRRNLPLALVGGVAAVTLIYLAVNAAYLAALGFDGASASQTPAADALATALGTRASQLASLLVMISALGAINGMIFTGSRVFAAFGRDHRLFHWLGRRERSAGSPGMAVAAQAGVTLAMIFAVGTPEGQRAINAAFARLNLRAIPWKDYHGGFETLLAATAPVFWALFLAVGAGLIVLRFKHPRRKRPFAVPWYPLPPLAFCTTCGFMLYSSIVYAQWLVLLGLAPVALGIVLYAATHVRSRDALPRSG